jgi:plastocyanin
VSGRAVRVTVACAATAVVAAGVAALASAAASKTAGSAPAGVVVSAGPLLKAPPPGVSRQADALAFFPRGATVVAGQSVTFVIAGFHTVTFGNPRSFPFVVPFPHGKQPAQKDAAGAPMWWSGTAPLLSVNPRAVPQLGGGIISSPSQVRSSGLLRLLAAGNKQPKPYVMTFARPGLYHFFCIVHPGMRGAIRVLPRTAAAPPPDQAAARGQAQLTRMIGDIKGIQSTNPTEKLAVWVGSGKLNGASVTSFFPNRLVVKRGETVKFESHDALDIHTVTFGPKAYVGQIEKAFISRKLAFNPFAVFPSDPPTPTQLIQPPPPPAPAVYDGANHGNGYLNAGIVYPYASPQRPHLFRVTFTRPGIYHYECVIHPNMDGTIVVK